MPENPDPLIQAVVRRMDDLELKLAAERELVSRTGTVDPSGHFDPPQVMISRWDRADARSTSPHWKRGLYAMVVLAILASIALHFHDAIFHHRLAKLSFLDLENFKKPARDVMDDPSWSEDERLLLFGDQTRPENERRKTLWERHPANPSYFAEYTGDFRSKENVLPPDFSDIVARIDPDNSYFPYLEASLLAENAIERKRLTPAERKSGDVLPWAIKDQAKLEQALTIAAGAAGKPRYEDYHALGASRRNSLLRQETREERVYTMLLQFSGPNPSIRFIRLASAYAARASQLAVAGDKASFRSLLSSAEGFLNAQATVKNASIVDMMVLSTNIKIISKEFSKAAATLDMTEEAARMKSIHDRMVALDIWENAYRKVRSPSPFAAHGDFIFAGGLTNLRPILASRTTVSDEALLPGSFADHALASRTLALILGLIFSACLAIVALARFTSSRLIRSLGTRFLQLLDARDYCWIIGVGVVAPTLYVLSVSYLTDLGGRQWSLSRTSWILPAAHFAALLVMILCLAVLLTRWRLHVRAGYLGLGPNRRSVMGWFGIIVAAASVPAIGWYVNLHEPPRPQSYSFGAILIPACLWLIVIVLRSPYGSLERRLTAATASRSLMPTFACASILMMLLAIVFHWEDDYWFSRYDFSRFGKNGNPAIACETEMSASYQRELREILSSQP